jgi:hypothetical protein
MFIADFGRIARPHARSHRSRRLLQAVTPAVFLAAGLAAVGLSIAVSLGIGVELFVVTATLLALRTFAIRQRNSDRHL